MMQMMVLVLCRSAAAWSTTARLTPYRSAMAIHSPRPALAIRLCDAPAAATSAARTCASGLVYEELSAGSGASPTAADTVSVHYTGTLDDGTVFDSSYSRGEPTSFKVAAVIAGWQEGLALMKEGGKARLVIPPSLGYGSKQMNMIPPDSRLTFEVHHSDNDSAPDPDPAT